jgi:hypothetical protein
MDTWQAVMMTLAAVLVGALLPALIQLSLTLRSLRLAAERTGPALVAVTATAQRLEQVTLRLQQGERLDHLLESIDSLARTLDRFQDTARIMAAVGASVGPAVSAGVRAWRASRQDPSPTPNGAGDATTEHD